MFIASTPELFLCPRRHPLRLIRNTLIRPLCQADKSLPFHPLQEKKADFPSGISLNESVQILQSNKRNRFPKNNNL